VFRQRVGKHYDQLLQNRERPHLQYGHQITHIFSGICKPKSRKTGQLLEKLLIAPAALYRIISKMRTSTNLEELQQRAEVHLCLQRFFTELLVK
jgi:hypothetical protein